MYGVLLMSLGPPNFKQQDHLYSLSFGANLSMLKDPPKSQYGLVLYIYIYIYIYTYYANIVIPLRTA